MIFPDISLKKWLSKYPDLEIIEGTCRYCLKKRKTNIPFISKDYLGLVSEPCSCGKDDHISQSSIPISQKELKYWGLK